MNDNEIIAALDRYGLLLRPSLLHWMTGGWRCGVFLGITREGSAYCVKGTECEAPSIAEAVAEAVRRVEPSEYLAAS